MHRTSPLCTQNHKWNHKWNHKSKSLCKYNSFLTTWCSSQLFFCKTKKTKTTKKNEIPGDGYLPRRRTHWPFYCIYHQTMPCFLLKAMCPSRRFHVFFLVFVFFWSELKLPENKLAKRINEINRKPELVRTQDSPMRFWPHRTSYCIASAPQLWQCHQNKEEKYFKVLLLLDHLYWKGPLQWCRLRGNCWSFYFILRVNCWSFYFILRYFTSSPSMVLLYKIWTHQCSFSRIPLNFNIWWDKPICQPFIEIDTWYEIVRKWARNQVQTSNKCFLDF